MPRRPFDSKIPGRTISEVSGRFEAELARQASIRKLKFNGKKLSAEAMTNAIVLHFLEMSEDDRDRILDRFVLEFDSLMNEHL